MIGSLFSGIGGLELGLERAGLGPVAWQVEIDPWCRRVLAKHWPEAERFEDVKAVGRSVLAPVDVICGGFPCQDVSSAGLGRGIAEGTRSGLWFEFRRIVGELRPAHVVVENVASGLSRWLPTVRRDLFLLGYRTRAVRVAAFDVGAPHRRARVFVLAANGNGNGNGIRIESGRGFGPRGEGPAEPANDGATRTLANTDGLVRFGREQPKEPEPSCAVEGGSPSDADRDGQPQPEGRIAQFWRWSRNGDGWQIEPPVRGVDDGLPRRLDRGRRLKGLGNAVVPQCAEVVGRMLMAAMAA